MKQRGNERAEGVSEEERSIKREYEGEGIEKNKEGGIEMKYEREGENGSRRRGMKREKEEESVERKGRE